MECRDDLVLLVYFCTPSLRALRINKEKKLYLSKQIISIPTRENFFCMGEIQRGDLKGF